ncbi:MAG: hypothetical protein HZY79_07280 [Rhodoblastus sp.]|nr:MAG: hypothetical protein HZY79_07280 [Rhodoblastus sp.]
MRYAHEVKRRQLVQLDAKSWRLTIFAGLAVLAVLSGLAVSGVSDPSTLTSGALACAGAILIGKFMIRRQIARAQTIAIDDLARREDVFGRPVTLIVDDAGLSIEMAGADDLRAFAGCARRVAFRACWCSGRAPMTASRCRNGLWRTRRKARLCFASCARA